MAFSVQDFHDLLRLLEERPEWRAEIRRVVLTDELLRLPEEFARSRQETDQRFRELAERLEALTQRLDGLTGQVSTLAGHVGTLRGESLERRYRERPFAYFGRELRDVHVLTSDELRAMLDDAIESRALEVAEAQDVGLSDLVVRGRRRRDGVSVYFVIEVSAGIGPDDVQRATRRAELLGRTGITALPVVAGQWMTPEGMHAARAFRVWQITDGHIAAPDPRPD